MDNYESCKDIVYKYLSNENVFCESCKYIVYQYPSTENVFCESGKYIVYQYPSAENVFCESCKYIVVRTLFTSIHLLKMYSVKTIVLPGVLCNMFP